MLIQIELRVERRYSNHGVGESSSRILDYRAKGSLHRSYEDLLAKTHLRQLTSLFKETQDLMGTSFWDGTFPHDVVFNGKRDAATEDVTITITKVSIPRLT